MTTDVDVVVVGAGVMGAATARAVARSGRSVVVLERFEVGHAHGSSHGDARIFRLSYDDPEYVGMAARALGLWRELEREAGQEILVTLGGVDVGEAALANAAALRSTGAAFEVLDQPAAAERFPMIRFPPGQPILFQPDAGIVRADRAVAAFLASAREHGARVVERSPAGEILDRADGVEVGIADGVVRARVAVVTAGAWARPLLATAGIDLPVTPSRETAVYFRLDGEAPPILVEWTDRPFYALWSPVHGLKAAQHMVGPVADPDEPGEVDRGSVEQVRAWVAERFVDAAPEPVHAETCLYTNTADERFVMERRGNVVVGSPCSGHGFKFASFVGEHLAALAAA